MSHFAPLLHKTWAFHWNVGCELWMLPAFKISALFILPVGAAVPWRANHAEHAVGLATCPWGPDKAVVFPVYFQVKHILWVLLVAS